MFDNYLSINKKFKSSVNLDFDLNNVDKIKQYIPTTDLCDVIKKYIKSVLKGSNFKATTLSGPYGKGKSYLLLIILYFVSKREDKDLFNEICLKIKKVDVELYSLLIELDKSGAYLLPVVINNNLFEDMNKNFIYALSNSLEQNGFSEIVPNTTYKEALDIIDKWEASSSSGFDLVKICFDKKKCTLHDLKEGLKKFDSKYFEIFKDLYHCISQGLDFFSMKSDDIVNVYSDVCRKIQVKDKNCKGLFVVFDEFGSFLNNQSSDFVSKLNKIQSFAEKCNESDLDNQMHFCCITHKDILLYKKDKSYNDAFDTIAGRFETVRFDRSLDENYQIICSALIKKEKYKENVVDNLYDKYWDSLSLAKSSGLFTDKQFSFILNNGLPINPITLYCLIQISEKIAQNERTLFTFISDNNVDGFKYFIANNSDTLLNVDAVYNYFSDLIKDNEEYKMLYYKVESLKKSTLKESDYSIFKAIALIKLINDPLKFNCTINNLAMSLSLAINDCEMMVNYLIEKKLLKKNLNDDSIDFAIIADDKLNKLISDTVDLQFSNIDLGNVLIDFEKNHYEISHEYNFKNQMVRFYKTIYLEASKLISFSNLNNLLEEERKKEYFDGLIINLINDNHITKKQVVEILMNNSENVIVRYVDKNISNKVINKVKEILAAKYICLDKKNLSENFVKTLPLLIDDMSDEVNEYLLNLYSSAKILNKREYKNAKLTEVIYNSFNRYYSETLRFNNEQVNKNNVQSVTIKARNNVIDCILNQKNLDYSKTSQEATIYNAFINSDSKDIVNYISQKICDSKGDKILFSELISNLTNAPYGLRNGIIPILVAQAISNLTVINSDSVDSVLIYNDSVEVDLDSNNLSKACLNPDKYFYSFTQLNIDKIKMTDKLMNLFNCKKYDSFSENVKNLNYSMKNFVSGLAPVIVKSSKKDNLLNLSETELNFKNQYLQINNNNYELLFYTLPNLLNCKYEKVEEVLENLIYSYSSKLNDLYSICINKVQKLFGGEDGSLKSTIVIWLSKYPHFDNIIFDNKYKNIAKNLKNIDYNDHNAINILCNGAVKCSVDDLNNRKFDDFINLVSEFVNKVEENNHDYVANDSVINPIDINKPLSSLGNTLYNNILDQVDEYGDSISNEEKALIYKKLLDNLLK